MKTMPILGVCLAGLAAAAPAPAREENADSIKAITRPSKDLTLAFTQSGRIAKVLVKEGQDVKAGQPLVELDDSVERMHVSLLKAKADNTAPIRAAEVKLARKRAVFEKVKKAHDAKAAPERELGEAKMEMTLAELDLETSRFENRQHRAAYLEGKLALDRMRLHSPVAGRVERIEVQPGEAVDALAATARVVRIHPLWIDVPVPLALARTLAARREATVRFPDTDTTGVRGEVIRVSAVADAASETLEVRVEVPNPTGRPAGEHVTVSFPPDAKGPEGEKKRLRARP